MRISDWSSDVCSSDLTVTQRRGQAAGACGRTNQRERRQIEPDRARSRTFADHDVELVVLHRRVQHFLDDRTQAMNFIDEQQVARIAIGQQRRPIARSEEPTSELQSIMRISYAVFCLKKTKKNTKTDRNT